MISKNIVLLTRHYFSRYTRKTTVHFLALEFARLGYQVHFVTVGRSRAAVGWRFGPKAVPPDLGRSRWAEVSPGVKSIVLDEIVHPVSFRSRALNRLSTPFLIGYGSRLPSHIADTVADSTYVVVECGYAVAYFRTLERICKQARFIYLATDPLQAVDVRPEIAEIERSILPNFDLVRVANPTLAKGFPAGTNVRVIPQGVEKSVFDRVSKSPYEPGTKNAVSVGDMLFDQETILEIARQFPNLKIHVFGAKIRTGALSNILVYGEREFSSVAPYIKHADIGLMPYKLTPDTHYLVKTSLKILQYCYCGLPVLAPDGVDWGFPNVVTYKRSDPASIGSSVSRALDMPISEAPRQEIWDWSECANELLECINRPAPTAYTRSA